VAPTHHAAMRHVGAARSELGTRTIFNLLGPLSNPAGVTRQLIGVFSGAWLEPMAQVLRNLGSERVWITHGGDGLDEMTTTGPTKIVELRDGDIRSFEVSPEDVGLKRSQPSELKGGDAVHNAAALVAVLEGAQNAYRDIAVLNAAGALVVAGKARELGEGVDLAGAALKSGRARQTLAKLVQVSND
jgi:anthranilate phosphoribosyltransferase